MKRRTFVVCVSFLAIIITSLLMLFAANNFKSIDESYSFYIFGVPYVRQDDAYWCGPACLTMVLQYWGVNVTQEEISSMIHDPQAKITTMSSMKAYPLKYGFRTEECNGSISFLKT